LPGCYSPKMNRGFLYGDGFFESIRIENGTAPLLRFHTERIIEAFNIYQMTPSFDIHEVLQKSVDKYHTDGILRINFYRDGKGKYLPETDNVVFDYAFTPTSSVFFLPESSDLQSSLASAPQFHGNIGIYLEPKPNVPWMTVKSLSSAYYVFAAKYKQQIGLEYLLIQNSRGEICEELVSNIIVQIGDRLIVPSRNCATLRYLLSKYGTQLTEEIVTLSDVESATAIYSCKGSIGVSQIK
jgi:branched-chain amino acid aminotransferase